jgi:succinate-acetate transporter protein
MILGMGVWYGGLAQIIAGIMEWKKGNTFGTVAFTSYGLFWISLVAMTVMPKIVGIDPPDATARAAYLFMWGLFTLVMFIGTLKLNHALQVVFGTLTILFFLLAWGVGTENEAIEHIAGWEGIVCGLSAMYTGLAQVLNEMYGKTVWPLGTK